MSTKLEKRGEKDDAVLRNTEEERDSGMRSVNTPRRKWLSVVSWRKGCNQQKQSQMQIVMEANFDLINKETSYC